MGNQRMLGVVVSVAAVLAIAGCSAKPTAAARSATPAASASRPAPSASSPPNSTTGTHSIQRCHTSDLTGHVEGHGAGAGQRYAALGLTNKTARSCTIHGYPGLQLVDAYGRNRQTRTSWIRSTGPTRLVVRPGQTVWALLHWTVVEADEEEWANDCAPDPAGLRVIPPDETTQLSMAFDAGRLCQHGEISVGAFGRGRPVDG